MYILGRVSGSELVVKTVLGDTLYQTSLSPPSFYENLLPLQISIFILGLTHYFSPTRYSSLDVSHYFQSSFTH